MEYHITTGPDWQKSANHQDAHTERQVKAIAEQGLDFLRTNATTIQRRAGRAAGALMHGTFWRSLQGLSAALLRGDRVNPVITKGIHQFVKGGERWMPHITVQMTYADPYKARNVVSAHFWLSIGKPSPFIDRDPDPLRWNHLDNRRELNGERPTADYRVAQVSLSVDGPFLPGSITSTVRNWSNDNLPVALPFGLSKQQPPTARR